MFFCHIMLIPGSHHLLEDPLECNNSFSIFLENLPTVEKLTARLKPMTVADPFLDENGDRYVETYEITGRPTTIHFHFLSLINAFLLMKRKIWSPKFELDDEKQTKNIEPAYEQETLPFFERCLDDVIISLGEPPLTCVDEKYKSLKNASNEACPTIEEDFS